MHGLSIRAAWVMTIWEVCVKLAVGTKSFRVCLIVSQKFGATFLGIHPQLNQISRAYSPFWHQKCLPRLSFSGRFAYSVADEYANRPVNFVCFWDAVRFTNWLNNGQGDGDTETGACTLPNGYRGADGRSITRNSGAKWVLPSEDEWYKSAYHKNDGITENFWDYPTAMDMPTTPGRDMTELTNEGNNANYFGSPISIDSTYYTTVAGEFQWSDSTYETFDQGGNVSEWNESVVMAWDTVASRGLRGGSFQDGSNDLLGSFRTTDGIPTNEGSGRIGFRVALIPEPGSLPMLLGIALTGFVYWLRKRN
jgi:formylglycine-generating enzyme